MPSVPACARVSLGQRRPLQYSSTISAKPATIMRKVATAIVSWLVISSLTMDRLAPHSAMVPNSSQRIEAAPNITLLSHTEVCALYGDTHLAQIDLCTRDETPRRLNVRHLFLFLGAEPSTAWLGDCVDLDDKNFVLTGPQVSGSSSWPLERSPHFLETSRPRIFAVGDVRSGSVKRVAAAVGEGSAAVQSLHQVLASD